MKFHELRKQFEDNLTWVKEIEKGWNGKRTNHRCYAVKLLLDKTQPFLAIYFDQYYNS